MWSVEEIYQKSQEDTTERSGDLVINLKPLAERLSSKKLLNMVDMMDLVGMVFLHPETDDILMSDT